MVDLQQLNPLREVGIGDIGVALLIFFMAIAVVCIIGFVVWWVVQRKQLKHIIPLMKKVGNNIQRVKVYRAKDYKVGLAGDKLWYVPKAKKFLPPATLQTAPNEYPHFEREDGEWININFPDIDEDMKKMGVKYLHQDMRSNRIAISNILEQRFKGKVGLWEKYGAYIVQAIFFLIVAICMVIIFYQWSEIIEQTNQLLGSIKSYRELECPTPSSIIPVTTQAILIFFIGGLKRYGRPINIL